MYSFHFAFLALATYVVAPALSAPLTPASVVAARDPTLSLKDIRDLLKDFDLRSEDVSAGLYGRDSDDQHSSLHARLPGFFSGFAQGFDSVFDAAGDVISSTATGLINAGETVANGAAKAFDDAGNAITGQ